MQLEYVKIDEICEVIRNSEDDSNDILFIVLPSVALKPYNTLRLDEPHDLIGWSTSGDNRLRFDLIRFAATLHVTISLHDALTNLGFKSLC